MRRGEWRGKSGEGEGQGEEEDEEEEANTSLTDPVREALLREREEDIQATLAQQKKQGRSKAAFESWKEKKRDALAQKRERAAARGQPDELSSDDASSRSGSDSSDEGDRERELDRAEAYVSDEDDIPLEAFSNYQPVASRMRERRPIKIARTLPPRPRPLRALLNKGRALPLAFAWK